MQALGTPCIAYEVVRRALQPYGLCPAGKCTGLTEMSKDRRDALRRRVIAASSDPIFRSSEDLTSWLPYVQDLPIADHLFMGIVCVDISRCSSTPKSLTDASGSSGKSWLDFLKYVDLLTFEERPKTITLECVENLSNNRTVQGHREQCMIIVIEALRERGYVGQWRKVSATLFFLSQAVPECGLCSSRFARAWVTRELRQAFDFISKSQTMSHEALKRILDSSPLPYAHGQVPTNRGKGQPGI